MRLATDDEVQGKAARISSLTSSRAAINGCLTPYALPREHDLWGEFKLAMHGTDTSQWLYNQRNETTDRPGDLGYFIGYRIAEAFYERATDKRLALEAIIEVADSDMFLAQSGYEP